MGDRPTPPDPFARKGTIAPAEQKPSLTDALSSFAPKPIEDSLPTAMPVANIAPDTGRGGRPRRRGDVETRTKAINFRMKPREELPPPDADIQRRAESGKLTSDFVKGRQNGNG